MSTKDGVRIARKGEAGETIVSQPSTYHRFFIVPILALLIQGAPRVSGQCNLPLIGGEPAASAAFSVVISGDFAYMAAYFDDFKICDISNPRSPTHISTGYVQGFTFDVVVAGTLAYLSDHANGLRVYDISDPWHPTTISTLPIPGNPRGVVISGDLLYMACHTAGLQIVDVSDPFHPVVIGGANTPKYSADLVIRDNLVYQIGRAHV